MPSLPLGPVGIRSGMTGSFSPCDKGHINRNVPPTTSDLCPYTPQPSSTEASKRHQRTGLQLLAFKLGTAQGQVRDSTVRTDSGHTGWLHPTPTRPSELVERKKRGRAVLREVGGSEYSISAPLLCLGDANWGLGWGMAQMAPGCHRCWGRDASARPHPRQDSPRAPAQGTPLALRVPSHKDCPWEKQHDRGNWRQTQWITALNTELWSEGLGWKRQNSQTPGGRHLQADGVYQLSCGTSCAPRAHPDSDSDGWRVKCWADRA